MELFRIFRSPDGDVPAAPRPPRKKGPIPKADGDLSTLAQLAATRWASSPLTLIWTSSGAFSATVNSFKNSLQSRRDTGALRPGVTYTLKELTKQMSLALPEVKVYIQGKYKKAGAEAQYPRYGMIHRNGGWILPTDRDDLKLSLASMIAAIAADGFGTNEYGTTFWTNMKSNFEASFDSAKGTDSSVSEFVGAKNAQKEAIVKTLNALIHLIQANYPDNYEAELRAWGFQREDY